MENLPEKQKTTANRRGLISIAFQLGFIIALPIVVLGLGGKWLDRRMETAPLFTLAGILFAIVSTSVWIYRKFKNYF